MSRTGPPHSDHAEAAEAALARGLGGLLRPAAPAALVERIVADVPLRPQDSHGSVAPVPAPRTAFAGRRLAGGALIAGLGLAAALLGWTWRSAPSPEREPLASIEALRDPSPRTPVATRPVTARGPVAPEELAPAASVAPGARSARTALPSDPAPQAPPADVAPHPERADPATHQVPQDVEFADNQGAIDPGAAGPDLAEPVDEPSSGATDAGPRPGLPRMGWRSDPAPQ